MKNFDLNKVSKKFDSHLNSATEKRFFKEEGTVLSVEDGIVTVSGLSSVMMNELVLFENNERGLAFNLEEDTVGIIMLDSYEHIFEGNKVQRTEKIFEVPVGDDFLGRVVDANARPIDGKGEIKASDFFPIEKIAPGVMARKSVHQPLKTGVLSIDAMFPIGKGQRELIIGDRQTGKTTVAIDTIINQKNNNVKCIYVAIGQKNSTVANLITELNKNKAMDYTTVVSATASDLPSLQYIAPYSATAIAEYWLSKGEDVLIVYDDLSAHAVAYRTLSLLLKRPPGREAYPGDVFYLHSRLLERSCKLNEENGGGSITSLPIIQTQAGDISAYIPTNVISITDGQIFMMTSLFNSGQRPAIDAGLSVSRVGGAAQVKSVKQMSGSMKLGLANYRELKSFSQFGSELDEMTKRSLSKGEKIQKLLIQKIHESYSPSEEAVILFAIKENFIDYINVDQIIEFKNYLIKEVKETRLWAHLEKTQEFDKKGNWLAFRYFFKDLIKDFLREINYQPTDKAEIKKLEELSDIKPEEEKAYRGI